MLSKGENDPKPECAPARVPAETPAAVLCRDPHPTPAADSAGKAQLAAAAATAAAGKHGGQSVHGGILPLRRFGDAGMGLPPSAQGAGARRGACRHVSNTCMACSACRMAEGLLRPANLRPRRADQCIHNHAHTATCQPVMHCAMQLGAPTGLTRAGSGVDAAAHIDGQHRCRS